jgi:transposase
MVSRLLADLGHEAIVAHSRNVRLIGESRRKDDRLDAQVLARLARIDPQLLSPFQHRSAQAQADLSVIRARYALVPTRTALVCAARGLTKSFGERLRGRSPQGFSSATSEALSPQLQIARSLTNEQRYTMPLNFSPTDSFWNRRPMRNQ